MDEHEILDVLEKEVDDLRVKVGRMRTPAERKLETKANALIEKGKFDTDGAAQTHVLRHDPDLRREYYREQRGGRSSGPRPGESALLRKARQRVKDGDAETVGKAATKLLEENVDGLADRYYRREDDEDDQ